MDIELLTIGTELLLGFTVDTNGAWLGRTLSAEGLRVVHRASVGDDAHAIAQAVRDALARTGAVLCTGGLGPTRDDLSKRAVAGVFGVPLEFHAAIWDDLVARFDRLGRRISETNRVQAEVPRGATVLPNRWGTAPGLWLEGEPGLVIMLPGVPREMMALVKHEVLPRLRERAGGAVVRSRTVRTTLIPESTLAERIGEVEGEIAPLTLAYLPGTDGVDLRLTAWQLPPAEADARLAAAAAELARRAGDHAYGRDDDDLAALVLERAAARGWSVGAAESCTGGLLGGRLTAIPGSSRTFRGAVVAYDNAVKTTALGVDAGLIAEHGAVSEAVARAMARGARLALGVDAAAAVTGIAGPGGGTPEKPVGTVWLAACAGDREVAHRAVFPGNRAEIRARAAQGALYWLWRVLGEG